MTQTPRRPERKRRGDARRAFAAALRRIQADCKACKSAEEWYDQLKPLRDDLQTYQTDLEQHLTVAQRDRLKRAMELVEASRAGIDRACDTLEKEVNFASRVLPPAVAMGPLVIAVIIVVAAAAGAGEFARRAGLFGDSTSVIVSNQKCPPISLEASQLPGVGGSVGTNSQSTVSLPAGDVDIDARQADRIVARLAALPAASVTVHIPTTVNGIRLDGVALPKTLTTRNLPPRSSHTLQISCG